MRKLGIIIMMLVLINFSVVSAVTTISNSGNSTFTSGIEMSSNNIWANNFFGSLDWNDLLNVPTGLNDGDDDTTYTAGSNLTLTGTTFSSNMTSLKLWFDLFYQPIGNYVTLSTLVSYNYFNTTNFPYTSLSNFTDDLGNRGYTDLINFSNSPLYITNATMNKSVACTDILGSDSDFCVDATGGDKWIVDSGSNYLYNDTTTLYFNETFLNDTIDQRAVVGGSGGNSTEEMVDAVLSQANKTIEYSDATDSWGINETWIQQNITGYGYLTSYTETDPLWTENYTLFNTTWSTDTDTTYGVVSNGNLTLTGTNFDANMTSIKNWFDLFYQTIGTYLSNLVEDTTPQLGGNLDTNGNNITLGSDFILNQSGGASIYHNGTGWVIIG